MNPLARHHADAARPTRADREVRYPVEVHVSDRFDRAPELGERDVAGIRQQLRVALAFTMVYVVVVVTPCALLLGDWLAEQFTEGDETRDLAAAGMGWLPLATLAMAPFFPVRSAFEGMGLPRHGLVVSATRAALLVLPLTFLGMHLADAAGRPELVGAFAGSTLGTLIASLGFVVWMSRTLSRALGDARARDSV